MIAGENGFIGRELQERFRAAGNRVKLISRRKEKGVVPWEQEAISDALEGSDLLLNLAGYSVDCRYHQRNKERILRSRTETTALLGEAILKCACPPELWCNSSTATIYRHALDRPMDEKEGEIGSDFSMDVARAWEERFFSFELPDTRKVALRSAIVLGKSGGIVPRLRKMVNLGLGGRMGNGKQVFSWIHIEDLYHIIRFLHEKSEMRGPVNLSSPYPVTNETLMRTFRRCSGMPFGLPLPKWLLELGAFFMRTETELVLKSRWVLPARLQEEGYEFLYPDLQGATQNLLKKN